MDGRIMLLPTCRETSKGMLCEQLATQPHKTKDTYRNADKQNKMLTKSS